MTDAEDPGSLLRSLRVVVGSLVRSLRGGRDEAAALRELARWLAREADRLDGGAGAPAGADDRAADEPAPPAVASPVSSAGPRAAAEPGAAAELGAEIEREPAAQPDAGPQLHGEQPPAEPAIAEEAPRVARTLRIGGRAVTVAAKDVGGTNADAPPPPAGRVDAAPPPVDPEGLAARDERPEEPRRDWARELADTIRSAGLKARACDLALRGIRQSDAELDRRDRDELLAEARALPSCYLWPLDPRVALPPAPLLDLCARAYENLAAALEVVGRVPRWVTLDEQADEDLLHLAAEAQSMLFWALEPTDLEKDTDQLFAFVWLKEQTARHRVYLPRFMSLHAPADPTAWRDLALRVEQLDARIRDREEGRRARKRLADKLRYQVGKLQEQTDEELARAGWNGILRTLVEWVESGRQPSSREVCDPLLPVVDDMPDGVEVPAPARRVFDALDEQLAARQRAAQPAERAEPRHAPEVAQARALLAGKVVLLIGGQRRAFEAERLERDLGLAELRWISTIAHRSLAPLEEEIWKPEVALVVIAPRWSDHQFIDLKQTAKAAGKPFLQLPGGYGTNQVAYQIMNQVSSQLGGSPTP